MMSLIKIRIKYIIRHPCLLFWTYLFLPIIILIAAIISIPEKEKPILKYFRPIIFQEQQIFFKEKGEDEYSNLKEQLNFTGFLVPEQKYCDEINSLFIEYDMCQIKCPICTNKESNFDNSTKNIIKISKKNGKYNIYLTSRYIDMNGPINHNENFFYDFEFDQDRIIDPYYIDWNFYYNYYGNIPYRVDIFFELQSFLARILIKIEGKEVKNNFEMNFGYNEYPSSYAFTYVDDILSPCSLISLILTLQFSLISYNINIRMIDEKESKLNILLERQGISKNKYMISWLFTFLVLFLFSIISFILLIFGQTNGHIYIFIINLILFTIALYSVCVFFTTCIETTKTGSTAIKCYNFGSTILGFAIILPKTNKAAKIIFAFIPQINYFMNQWTTFCFGNFEELSGDLLILKTAKISYIETIVMYIAEIIFYLGFALIIQSYKDSGLPFLLYIKSFFTSVSRNDINKVVKEEININNNLLEKKFEKYFQELSEINKQKLEQNDCLKLKNISKSFEDLKAVNNFNCEIFSNEIFCLLGHNGSGKTTTINMISGIFAPDEGDIFLNGKSLVTNKKYLYENIGLCQQEDIFFDYLTVKEHLEYMCRIKGSKVNQQEINELISKIELLPKKDDLCGTLSGGQKRKLCIALALIGNSKIILLDEPTSGMDVMARRSLWDFLKKYKKDKIILLTTHFLDEAEYLGDRIGIMSDGQLICCGTSSYLKSKYPCGFNINLILNSKIFNEKYKIQFFNEIKKYEPKAEIKVSSKSIFSFNIQSDNKNINEIFEYIEESKFELGIEDYTIGSTSLEDVFLKLNNKPILVDEKNSNNEVSDINNELSTIPKSSSFCKQLGAHICRNLYPLYRNKTLFFFELLSGLGLVYIFIIFFSDFFKETTIETFDFIEILEINKVYFNIQGTEENFLENSDAYKRYGKHISLKEINPEINDFEHFMSLAYDKSLANIAKGALMVKKEKLSDKNYYKVLNTEVNTGSNGYFYADIMLFVSAFLKESYNIDATIFKEITFQTISENDNELTDILKETIILVIVCLINFFGFVIFLGGLMLEKIKEKRTNIKHLLYLSGNNIFSYWLGFYITDYIKLIFFTILLIIPIYTVNGCATFFGVDMLVINISSLSFIYFISFFCSKDDEGAKILFILVFGILIIIALIAIAFPDDMDKLINLTKSYAPNIFDITPVTSMAFSFIRLILSYTFITDMEKLLGEDNIKESRGFKRPEIYLYTSYIAQLLNIVFYSLLLILAESGLLNKIGLFFKKTFYFEKDINKVDISPIKDDTESNNLIKINNNQSEINNNKRDLEFNFNEEKLSGNPLENPFVQKEISKVNDGEEELSTRIINVTKTFYPSCFCCCCCKKGKVRAINHLHLGLEPNEKFGLLGFNGSGKTTTFRAITNEIMTDAGSINIFGYDTKTQFNYIRKIIGYCPQINPLFDFMKVKEVIEFYSKLKTCYESTDDIIKKFGLEKFKDTYTINLSGGSKRKLSFAIAIMNKPSLLLLDEPSTGVDPESRRIMWKNINELSNEGHKYNMILTTHSIEEAEVLCDTVSWLRAGNFITTGNPEELKLRYSAGYKLHIKFNEQAINELNNEINTIEQNLDSLSSLIVGLNDHLNDFRQIKGYESYLNSLIKLVEIIKNKTKQISLYFIGQDFSFELIVQIIKEQKKDLFCELLNLKNNDKSIDELTITLQSLENILTHI